MGHGRYLSEEKGMTTEFDWSDWLEEFKDYPINNDDDPDNCDG
jgi:hypothetical protein